MKDYSNEIEELLLNDDYLRSVIDVAIHAYCDKLEINASQYIHHISIAQNGVDLSKEGQRRQVQQDIHNYLAKGGEVIKVDEVKTLLAETKELNAKLEALMPKE